MNYRKILQDIEQKICDADAVAAEVYQGSEFNQGYGRGRLQGITAEEGANFHYYEYSSMYGYTIPLAWIEMPEDELREFLTRTRKGQEEATRLKKQAELAKHQAERDAQERATYERLRLKFEIAATPRADAEAQENNSK